MSASIQERLRAGLMQKPVDIGLLHREAAEALDALLQANRDCMDHFNALKAEHAALQSQLDALRAAAKGLTKFYAHIWDRVDGCIVLHPESVDAFEEAHAALESAIEGKPPATSGDA